MNASMHIVCPSCNTTNRVPQDRLADRPVCGRCKASLFQRRAVDLTAANFEKHLVRSDLPLLVDFWAPWCGPCKMMAPAFEQAAARLEPRLRLGKVNTQAEPSLGARFGVRGIPTVVLFRKGLEVARESGAMDLSGIMQWVDAVM